MKAYHFTNGKTLRDGRPIPAIGETLTYKSPLVLCERGLHASIDILDAVRFAPGTLLHVVECGGKVIYGNNKLVCSERTIIRSIECNTILQTFARWCALSVMHLWDVPDIVRTFLETGREDLKHESMLASERSTWSGATASRMAAAHAATLAATCTAFWPSVREAADCAAKAVAQPAEYEASLRRARDHQRGYLLLQLGE